MQFCILYCEVKESVSNSDSFTYFCIKYNKTNNLIKDTKKYKGVCDNLKDIIDDVDCEVQIFTQYSFDKLKQIENFDFSLHLLTSFLGLPQTCSLYDIFSFYFDTDSKLVSDSEMIEVIITSILTQGTNIQYSYCVYFCEDNRYSFCWFYINEKSKVQILGSDTITLKGDEFDNFKLGKSMKSLRYKIAISGCCISRVKYLSWGTNSLERYISDYIDLSLLISEVTGLRGYNYNDLVRILSTNLKLKYEYSAKEFMTALSQSSQVLNLKSLDDGSISISDLFVKDYSLCDSTTIDKTRCKWGIILDCEGNRDNKSGLRELGGIIFCRHNDILLSVETFECTEILLEETLQQAIKDYESNMGRYIPARGIDIFTFGSIDEVMIEDSLRAVSSKQFRKRIKRLFKYHDCRDFAYTYLSDYNITIDDKKTLSNVAKAIGVSVVTPKHNALADCRTLFNVLAFILQETGNWVLEL